MLLLILIFKISWLLPDLSPTFIVFRTFFTDPKVNFTLLFNSAKFITWKLRATLKGKNLLLREQILSFNSSPQVEGDMPGLSLLKVHSSPLNRISEDYSSHLFSNCLTFQVLSKFPWPSTKFLDFSVTWKNKIFFHKFFPDLGKPPLSPCAHMQVIWIFSACKSSKFLFIWLCYFCGVPQTVTLRHGPTTLPPYFSAAS